MSKAIIRYPDEIMCELSFEMKIKDWKQVCKTLRTNQAYTELQVINEIVDMIDQLESRIYPKSVATERHKAATLEETI